MGETTARLIAGGLPDLARLVCQLSPEALSAHAALQLRRLLDLRRHAIEHVVQRLVLVRERIVFDGAPGELPGVWHDPSHGHAHPHA